MSTRNVCDAIVVGGGVVGCATVFHLTNLGYKCVLLEKNHDLLSEASCGNSGMLHTGFDAPDNSLELSCIRACQRDIYRTLDKLGLPYNRVGATMVAWDQIQGDELPRIQAISQRKDIADILSISTSELYQSEPNLKRNAHSALWIPGETVVDPLLVPLAMVHHAHRRGTQIWRNCELQSCERHSYGSWTVTTNQKTFNCQAVINCAGLHGDKVDQLVGKQNFNILPRKGQFIVYDKQKGNLINSSILPVPTNITKGIIIFKSVYNNLIVGPTAEDVESRNIPALDPTIKGRLLQHAQSTLPNLTGCDVIGGYTGVRPATQYKDYQISSDPLRQWITVGGIRSTGLSGCLGIAHHVSHLLTDDLHLEPTQGRSLRLEPVNFNLHPDQQLVEIDGCHYRVTHPITQFGRQTKSAL